MFPRYHVQWLHPPCLLKALQFYLENNLPYLHCALDCWTHQQLKTVHEGLCHDGLRSKLLLNRVDEGREKWRGTSSSVVSSLEFWLLLLPSRVSYNLIIAGTQIWRITRTLSISRPLEDLKSGSVPPGLSKIGRGPILNHIPCRLLTRASAVSFLEIFYGYSSHSASACNDLTIFQILKACQKCMGHVSFGTVYQVLLFYLGFP